MTMKMKIFTTNIMTITDKLVIVDTLVLIEISRCEFRNKVRVFAGKNQQKKNNKTKQKTKNKKNTHTQQKTSQLIMEQKLPITA